MKSTDVIEPWFFKGVDAVFGHLPQPFPSIERLKATTIFSHRGEHDNFNIIENSLAAFEKALLAGVGGIEFDVRWTRDLVPVVFHDVDLRRIFNVPGKISDISMQDLRHKFPVIPSLDEVVAAFGKRLRLMIELKKDYHSEPKSQAERLVMALKALNAEQDFHLISLNPDLFNLFKGFPPNSYLPIARIHVEPLSRLSLDKPFGGITGHYLFITKALIARHQRAFQKIGTGFIHSRNSLFREINRGVEWIFSNRASWLQGLVNDLIDGH
jgi:glycerophosphoryl diester phosphodiesterase